MAVSRKPISNRCEQNTNMVPSLGPSRLVPPRMSSTYLDRLNSEQRRAVEHGVGATDSRGSRPLLVIAGAGSGKTSTLAHRVAHLVVNGADPRRILLMTFSRRAAAEMTRRAERIIRSATGAGAAGMADRLSWAGTFHAIGARLLRAHANEIGLNPTFTIHDPRIRPIF
jgi:DNA helicase II / ATP-dependent DNA helicase PcrA